MYATLNCPLFREVDSINVKMDSDSSEANHTRRYAGTVIDTLTSRAFATATADNGPHEATLLESVITASGLNAGIGNPRNAIIESASLFLITGLQREGVKLRTVIQHFSGPRNEREECLYGASSRLQGV